jgi:hypothetical protein
MTLEELEMEIQIVKLEVKLEAVVLVLASQSSELTCCRLTKIPPAAL